MHVGQWQVWHRENDNIAYAVEQDYNADALMSITAPSKNMIPLISIMRLQCTE